MTTDSLARISFSFWRVNRELTQSYSGSLPLKRLLLSSKGLLLLLFLWKRTVWGFLCLNTGWLMIGAAVPNNRYKQEDTCCNYVSVCVLYVCLQTIGTTRLHFVVASSKQQQLLWSSLWEVPLASKPLRTLLH